MNGKGPSSGGQQPESKSSFGELKNQGRNSHAPNTTQNSGRSRANAVFQTPTGRDRANAIFEAPGRSRSGAITGDNPGFKQIKNEGRSQGQTAPQRPESSFGNMQNQGRNAFQSAKDNRAGLTPNQQAGFNLVSGFMQKIMKEADRANAQSHDPGSKRSQQGQTGQFSQQNEEEEKRRLSIQSTQRDDDEDISAGDFFKRLQGALADPAKFRKEAAQRAAAKTENSELPQTRQRGGTIAPGSTPPNPLNDPAGYKRHQQAQQQLQKQQPGQPTGGSQTPMTDKSTVGQQPGKSPPSGGSPQQRLGNLQQSMARKMDITGTGGLKTNTPGLKLSPRKK